MGAAKNGIREKMHQRISAAKDGGTREKARRKDSVPEAEGRRGKRAKRAEQPAPKKGRSVSFNKGGRTASERNTSIMRTLIGAFMVPIVLIIILGVVSYMTASNTIKNKVEESSESTLAAMGMYCEMLVGNVSSKALELVASDNLSSY